MQIKSFQLTWYINLESESGQGVLQKENVLTRNTKKPFTRKNRIKGIVEVEQWKKYIRTLFFHVYG